MAKFIVTKDSYFQPFTYEQLEKPALEMQTAHNASQDAYDQLMAGTMSLEHYISQNPDDSDAKALYDNYKKKLDTLQNNLWDNGYNSQTRRDLATARAGFSSDMGRLSKAIESRQQRSKEWADMRHKNPELATGKDPGSYGLNDYLKDDNFGQNWWSYDASKFEAEVGADAQQRAKELKRQYDDPNNVVRNPALKATLTRIVDNGFTNDETLQASQTVDAVLNMSPEKRSQYYKENGVSEAVQILTESFLNRYNATGAREAADLDDTERQRFINRGKAGFAYGVLGKDVKDFTDPDYLTPLQREQLANLRQNRALTQAKIDEAKAKAGAAAVTESVVGHHLAALTNPEASRNLNGRFGGVIKGLSQKLNLNLDHPVYSKDGKVQAKDGVEAAYYVYDEKNRLSVIKDTGLDPGVDTSHFNPDNDMIGHITGKDGTQYETKYIANAFGKGKGAVAVRVEGSNTPWNKTELSEKLTQRYEAGKSSYAANLEWYKENAPDLYDAAKKLSPNDRYELYRKYNFDLGTSFTDFRDRMLASPDFNDSTALVNQSWFAQRGTDTGKYIDRFAGLLSTSLPFEEGSDSEFAKQKDWRSGNGSTSFIHPMTPGGRVDNKVMKNPNDVFMAKNGEITNINGIRLDENALTGDYFIVSTSNSKTPYAISASMLGLTEVNNTFRTAKQLIRQIQEGKAAGAYSESYAKELINNVVESATLDLWDQIGYDLNRQSQGGTKQENIN